MKGNNFSTIIMTESENNIHAVIQEILSKTPTKTYFRGSETYILIENVKLQTILKHFAQT